jgi:predicted nuclease with RNAse H fold
MSRSGQFIGIDVGARTLHCAAIDGQGASLDRAALPAADDDALARWCAGAAAVAIDAPEAPSTAPHGDDPGLAPKFRRARCAEIELGRRHGSWVSWVAPREPPFPSWMEAGFRAFATLRAAADHELLEVYPHACFRELAAGRRLARKQTGAGRSERAELLAAAGVPIDGFEELSHDYLDALVAALTALDRSRGRARRVTCGHDESAIWLPGRSSARSPRPARAAWSDRGAAPAASVAAP